MFATRGIPPLLFLKTYLGYAAWSVDTHGALQDGLINSWLLDARIVYQMSEYNVKTKFGIYNLRIKRIFCNSWRWRRLSSIYLTDSWSSWDSPGRRHSTRDRSALSGPAITGRYRPDHDPPQPHLALGLDARLQNAPVNRLGSLHLRCCGSRVLDDHTLLGPLRADGGVEVDPGRGGPLLRHRGHPAVRAAGGGHGLAARHQELLRSHLQYL